MAKKELLIKILTTNISKSRIWTCSLSITGGMVMLLHQMKLYASKADRAIYDFFIERGVIIEYEQEKVHGRQTCSMCSDGFRPHMKEKILRTCCSNGGTDTFFHQFNGNGEAMRFAFNSPLSDGFSAHMNADVWGMLKIKELAEAFGWAEELGVELEQHRVVHHWPCKAAISRNIDLVESIDLVVRGKCRIKHQMPGLKVALDLFCDWGPDTHSIALIKKESYLALISSDPLFEKQYDSWLEYAEEVAKLPVLKIIDTKKDEVPRVAHA